MGKHGLVGDEPVFVDNAGHRRRLLAGAGAAAGIVAIIGIATLAIGLMGGSSAALPNLPHKPRPASTGVQPGLQTAAPMPAPGPSTSQSSTAPGTTPTTSTATPGATPTSTQSHPGNPHSPTHKPSHGPKN
jgi:hypothetical protein